MRIIKDAFFQEFSTFNHARVLLAEDSKINQQIALELLQQVGLQVDVANNGLEVLQLLEEKAFDVVLMDLQMPLFDGYETTSIIRKKPQFKDLPIIAMTADTAVPDRDKCLSLGMNDHVVKSLDPKNLYIVLSKWLIKPSLDRSFEKDEDISLMSSNFPSYIEGIDLPVALENLGGNARLLKKLLFEFLQDHASDVNNIHQALVDGDVQLARRFAHTLHGVSGALGMNSISHISAALDRALRGDEEEFVDMLVSALEQPHNEVIKSIQQIKKNDADRSHAFLLERIVDKRQFSGIINAIGVLIAEMSPDAEGEAEELFSILTEKKERALIQILMQQLSEFDFDTAEETLSKIKNAVMAT